MSVEARIEGLVAEVEALDDPMARRAARALVSGVLELHAEALEAIVTRLSERDPALVRELVGDPTIAGVLLLHGLHPVPLAERARGAIAAIDVELRGYGATVVDVATREASVRVRVARDDPSRHGKAIREALERALMAATPDAEVVLEGVDDERLVPLGRLARGGEP